LVFEGGEDPSGMHSHCAVHVEADVPPGPDSPGDVKRLKLLA